MNFSSLHTPFIATNHSRFAEVCVCVCVCVYAFKVVSGLIFPKVFRQIVSGVFGQRLKEKFFAIYRFRESITEKLFMPSLIRETMVEKFFALYRFREATMQKFFIPYLIRETILEKFFALSLIQNPMFLFKNHKN